jgi:tRNA nucleotidyltransferase (CCA-adding enzyme)
MIEITGKKAGAWLKDMQHQMVLAVLKKEMKNDKESLIEFLNKNIK